MANVDVYVQSENVGLLAKTAKADEFNENKNSHAEFSDLACELEKLLRAMID